MSLAWSDNRAPAPRISEVVALEIRCDDCGKGARLEHDALSRNGDCEVSDFRARLVCSTCRTTGRAGRNVAAIPILRRAR